MRAVDNMAVATQLIDCAQDEIEFYNLYLNPVPRAIIEYVIKMGHTIKCRSDYGINWPQWRCISHSLCFRDDHICIFTWTPETTKLWHNIGINLSYADPHLFELIDQYLKL